MQGQRRFEPAGVEGAVPSRPPESPRNLQVGASARRNRDAT